MGISRRDRMPDRAAPVVRAAALGALQLAVCVVPGRSALIQDSLGWSYTAKVTAVWAAGNSESNTFGLGSTLRNLRERSELRFDAGALRTESGIRTRRAVGAPGAFRVEERTDREKTAESYLLRGRLDRKVSDRFLLYAGADWLRNTFAGIESRLLLVAGAGNIWAASDDFRFKTNYGVTVTFQEDVVDDPGRNSTFPGARFSWDLLRRLTSTTKFESVLITDVNLDRTDDVRVDFTNGLSVAIASAIALNPSLQLLWRNDPALSEIDLFTSGGLPTNTTVLVPLKKLDSFFTLALVVTL
jgi:putative salt-induced outer membrane protein YdiY